MRTNVTKLFVVSLLLVLSVVLAACGGGGAVQTIIVEGTPIVVTAAPPEVSLTSADPTTLLDVTFGDIDTLDPAWNYESAGNGVQLNVYEGLVFYNRGSAVDFIPALATDWTVSADGLTYTFTIREGVTFHGGETLDPGDVAYVFQRGILQGGGWSPQWLLTEPFFGIGVADIAELVDPSGALDDDPAGLQAADPALLLAACERVQQAIVDNGDGTVSFHLTQPWGPFIATLAASWGSIYDKDWAIANGTWDGDCATWQNFYGVDSETTPLREIMNGTGPFMLDHWTPGEEVVYTRFDNYWRTEPGWEGGPSGPAALERVVMRLVDEWGTRFAMMQAGDADFVQVPRQNVAQIDPLVGEICQWNAEIEDFDPCVPTENPNGPFRLSTGHPLSQRTDAMFVFDINVEGGNPLVGSGQLDGNGIPPDFFSDVHVRRAFNYCFDFDAFIAEALAGEGIMNVGYLVPGMIGYEPDGPTYNYDLEQCQAEIEQAWDGAVAENGFRFQVGYNTGNVLRQTVGQILQASFQEIDTRYQLEVVGLPWPTFLAGIRASRIPLYISGWIEDIHDPHNWAQPFLIGTYAARQRLPEEMVAEFSDLVDAGVAATDPEERAAIYHQLTQLDYDNAIAIRLPVATGRHYEQRWVEGWYYNPIYPWYYYYPLSKN
jgi:peptide/nickel transport system substrate-binding protein